MLGGQELGQNLIWGTGEVHGARREPQAGPRRPHAPSLLGREGLAAELENASWR